VKIDTNSANTWIINGPHAQVALITITIDEITSMTPKRKVACRVLS